MNTSEHLPGGSGGVWRVTDGDGITRVHRPTGAWTPAVHELLGYLRDRGVVGVPEVYGFDEAGQEVLSYLPGATLNPDTEQPSIEALAQAASWLRGYHDAVAQFTPTTDHWRQGIQPLNRERGEVICHNDTGLYNWVVVEGEFAGMIDWDRAGPGLPIDDLAFMVWSSVPLLRETSIKEQAERVELAAAAYGGVTGAELLEAVTRRMALIAARWEQGIANGDPGTIRLRDAGIMAKHEAKVAGFAGRKAALLELL